VEVLGAQGLSVAFGGVQALQDVSIGLEAGRVYGLIGPNGAGKTTLFNILTGVVRPSRGRVMLLGSDVTEWPVHRRASLGLSRTFQNLALFQNLTIRQNVVAGSLGAKQQGWLAAMAGRGSATPPTEVDRVLAKYGLQSLQHNVVRSTSLGVRKKVELARAVAAAPRVLLLDEPAAGLTPAEIDEFADLILELRDSGTAVLLVEHHMDLVMRLCEQIYVLDFGTVIARGTPQEVRRHPDVQRAYLGTVEAVT